LKLLEYFILVYLSASFVAPSRQLEQ